MTKSRVFFLALIIFALFLTGRVPARIGIPTLDSTDVKPKMTGYGLTVFTGIEPERFEIEVKGVLRKANGGDDLIIIEAASPYLDGHGPIAGMSGSPIFVQHEGEDKLIGALAYGWGFSLRPICGVTPIDRMMEVYDLVTVESPVSPEEQPLSLRAWPEALELMERGSAAPPRPLKVPQTEFAAMGIDGMTDASGQVEMQPLGTPLLVSTRSERVMSILNQTFEGTLMRPVMAGLQGSASGAGDDVEASLQNGSAFSVILVTGDLELSALGTATYVGEDRLVGFGHPMFGEGPIDVPIAFSEVYTTVPSLQRPFKLGGALKQVGALRQDRLWAVGASLEADARMIPLKLRVEAPETEMSRTYNYRLWDNRSYLPGLALSCVMDALDGTARITGPMSLELVYTLVLSDGRALDRDFQISGLDMAGLLSAITMAQDLSDLANNRYQAVDIDRIDAEVRIEQKTDVMVLEKVMKSRSTLRPGDLFKGKVQYGRWREEPEKFSFEFPLPRTMRPGSYEIHVMDGFTRAEWEYRLNPRLGGIESFDDFVKNRAVSYANDAVYILLIDPGQHLIVDGGKLSNLPNSITETTKATMREAAAIGAARGVLVREERRRFGAMVMGAAVLPITVTEK